MAEARTWCELAEAHRDLGAGPSSLSGLANLHSTIPYAFPAAIEFDGLGALSNALVCRCRHDRVSVVAEKRRCSTVRMRSAMSSFASGASVWSRGWLSFLKR